MHRRQSRRVRSSAPLPRSLAVDASANGTEAWELLGVSKLYKIVFFFEQLRIKRGFETRAKVNKYRDLSCELAREGDQATRNVPRLSYQDTA